MTQLKKERHLAKPSKTALANQYTDLLTEKQIISPDQHGRAVSVFEQYPKFFDIVKQGKFDLVKAEKFLQLSQDLGKKPHSWSSKVVPTSTKLSIATIRSYGSNDNAIGAISSVLIDFSLAAFGVALNALQVRLIATRIAEDYYFLSLDDLRTCLMRGIAGQYRQDNGAIIYGSFNLALVMQWLGDYDLELKQASARVSEEQSSKQKGKGAIVEKGADGLLMPDFIKQTAQKIEMLAEVKARKNELEIKISRAEANAAKARQVVLFCKERLQDATTTKAQAGELNKHLAQKTVYLSGKAAEINALRLEYDAILQEIETKTK